MSALSAAARLALVIVAVAAPTATLRAQVINGERTDDAAYAPRPPARWHSPEAEGEVPGGKSQDDSLDSGARSEKPRR